MQESGCARAHMPGWLAAGFRTAYLLQQLSKETFIFPPEVDQLHAHARRFRQSHGVRGLSTAAARRKHFAVEV